MDMQTFWREVEKIADEFNIGRHPLVQRINEGKASRDQIKQFAIEHYEMTVRDSGPYIAQGYVNMAKVDPFGAEMMAENFVEEAMGEHTHTGGHCELLYEFWEKGLGLPRQELASASASAAARAMNAYFWHMMTNKIRYSGALGILEGARQRASLRNSCRSRSVVNSFSISLRPVCACSRSASTCPEKNRNASGFML